MKKQRKQTDQQRREFLRNSIATGAGVAIAAAAPAVAVSATDADAQKPGQSSAGYQLSQHVLDYYKTCAR